MTSPSNRCQVVTVGFLLLFGTDLINGQQKASVNCPASSLYLPCSCLDTGTDTFSINCDLKSLNDGQVSTMLDGMISNGLTSKLTGLSLFRNLLTYVPVQIPEFTKLDSIELGSNKITALHCGEFDFTVNELSIGLSGNNISTMEPGSFKGNYGNNSKIVLDGNKITEFVEEVFLQVLTQMGPFSGYPNTYISLLDNAIDCTTDPCSLVWLLRDNPQLLKNVYYATCSNGTRFDQLNQADLGDCSGGLIPERSHRNDDYDYCPNKYDPSASSTLTSTMKTTSASKSGGTTITGSISTAIFVPLFMLFIRK